MHWIEKEVLIRTCGFYDQDYCGTDDCRKIPSDCPRVQLKSDKGYLTSKSLKRKIIKVWKDKT